LRQFLFSATSLVRREENRRQKVGRREVLGRNGTIYCHHEKAAASSENTAVTRISCLSEKVLFKLGEKNCKDEWKCRAIFSTRTHARVLSQYF
jgi:hypothetical protein